MGLELLLEPGNGFYVHSGSRRYQHQTNISSVPFSSLFVLTWPFDLFPWVLYFSSLGSSIPAAAPFIFVIPLSSAIIASRTVATSIVFAQGNFGCQWMSWFTWENWITEHEQENNISKISDKVTSFHQEHVSTRRRNWKGTGKNCLKPEEIKIKGKVIIKYELMNGGMIVR